MWPVLVRFLSHPRPFSVRLNRCDNPECPCTEVVFALVEKRKGSAPGGEPLQVQLRVDVLTWQEVDAPDRSPQAAAIAAEFLRDWPVGERELLRQDFEQTREMVRRLAECRIPRRLVETSELVSFREVAASDDTRDLGMITRWSCGEKEYLIDDLYCPHPDCNCQEVHLVFARKAEPKTGGEGPLFTEYFRVCLEFDGRWKVERPSRCTLAEATRLASRWLKRNARMIDDFKWRYEKIKAIGRRSLAGRSAVHLRDQALPESTGTSKTAAGRNDPCPCGSGKKYKRCCGRSEADRALPL
ncbi:MAG: SEC-C domain-containing protein [Pirellulales bacterium]|nr:SEC-C domain-containing protein [Pirellulales bacterium]